MLIFGQTQAFRFSRIIILKTRCGEKQALALLLIIYQKNISTKIDPEPLDEADDDGNGWRYRLPPNSAKEKVFSPMVSLSPLAAKDLSQYLQAKNIGRKMPPLFRTWPENLKPPKKFISLSLLPLTITLKKLKIAKCNGRELLTLLIIPIRQFAPNLLICLSPLPGPPAFPAASLTAMLIPPTRNFYPSLLMPTFFMPGRVLG